MSRSFEQAQENLRTCLSAPPEVGRESNIHQRARLMRSRNLVLHSRSWRRRRSWKVILRLKVMLKRLCLSLCLMFRVLMRAQTAWKMIPSRYSILMMKIVSKPCLVKRKLKTKMTSLLQVEELVLAQSAKPNLLSQSHKAATEG